MSKNVVPLVFDEEENTCPVLFVTLTYQVTPTGNPFSWKVTGYSTREKVTDI
jgi:hypothetical protein